MAIPIIPLITTALSLISSGSKAAKAKKAEKDAEKLLGEAPKYRPNQSILSYYDQALTKYNTAPTDTAEYKRDSQAIKQGTVQGLSSLNKLRSGNVASIIQGQNNALLNAAVKAESRKIREFDVLGNATRIKAGEEGKAFQQNEIMPFEGKYNLLTTKAAGYRAAQRQDTQNAYNNASAAFSEIAAGDNRDSWGTGKNVWGQPTRTVMGKSFTKPQYTKLNNTWGSYRSNYRTQ